MFRLPILVFASLALVALSLPSGSVLAHEEREVGDYVLEVGWAIEPTAVESPNSLFLKVEAKESGEGVQGLEETLEAEVTIGGGAQTKSLPLEASGEEPGVYGSPIIPTQTGDYTFRVYGTIDGQEVDESFSSGPETFDTVEGIAALQFPDQVPTNAELQAEIDESGGGSDSDTATILAIIGIVAAVIGICVGAFALAQRRS